jgi:hypothetical protein
MFHLQALDNSQERCATPTPSNPYVSDGKINFIIELLKMGAGTSELIRNISYLENEESEINNKFCLRRCSENSSIIFLYTIDSPFDQVKCNTLINTVDISCFFPVIYNNKYRTTQ